MDGWRARTLCGAVAISAGLVLVLRGQTADDSRFVILEHVGLPAVDEGVIAGELHGPGMPETLQREAFRASRQLDGGAVPGTRYVPGRVLVKFHDETSASARRSALSAVSRTAVMTD